MGDPMNRPPSLQGATATARSRKRLWFFRFFAAVVIPLSIVGVLETCLRMASFGYPTSFLLPASRGEEKVFMQNNQFGWRFFGPRLARLPEAICISQQKPPNTIRIFVLGESAAKGEPQPAFGLARMLQAVLSLRHPGVRFEVVNAAMTAINSHAVRAIAGDCARARGDIWVVYMGNNEVVGPFGAGTVFSAQSPPLPLIRASLALRSTRTGQLLESALAPLSTAGRNPVRQDEWRGMQMFLEQQVRMNDPRMSAVKSCFRRNLADVIEAGRHSGASIVVSTVAVNLRDCAPFASAHRAGLAAADQQKWNQFYEDGIRAQDAGNCTEAARQFQLAAKLDDSFAALQFRLGECALALGQTNEARGHFPAARDLDALRFRCDSALNEMIRAAVTNSNDPRVRLADAERVFTEQSPAGSPGSELFYEHVHPTFSGNYLLARTIAEQVEKLVPEWVSPNEGRQNSSSSSWPSEGECSRTLGWSEWSQQAAVREILVRMNAPPFTEQANHAGQLEALRRTLERLSPATQPGGESAAREALERALADQPDDPVLLQQLAHLKQSAGDLAGAENLVRRGLELLPSDSQAWQRLGLILTGQQKLEPAAAAFRRAIALDPADVLSRQNLAQLLWVSGHREEALAIFRRAVEVQPNFALGWLGLGQIYEELKDQQKADECFRRALNCRTTRATDLTALARFCRSRGWMDAAVTNYDKAIEVDPADAGLRIEAGEMLIGLGRSAEAARHFAQAIRVSPEFPAAHLLYGSMLGQQGDAVGAEREFRETLQLSPELLEARLNLGIALMSQGRSNEALECLDEVLQRSPTNELALKYSRALRAAAPAR
jgi:tetratricopeptide (TPR) repeat protein